EPAQRTARTAGDRAGRERMIDRAKDIEAEEAAASGVREAGDLAGRVRPGNGAGVALKVSIYPDKISIYPDEAAEDVRAIDIAARRGVRDCAVIDAREAAGHEPAGHVSTCRGVRDCAAVGRYRCRGHH